MSKVKGHMGTGNKTDFTKQKPNFNAGPASYTIPSIFDYHTYKKNGSNFRISRSQQRQHSYVQLTKYPGVGKYKINNNQPTQQYTIPFEEIGCVLIDKEQSKVPAPNHYDQTIKIQNSKYKNRGDTVIQPPLERQYPNDANKFMPITVNQFKVRGNNLMN